MGETADRGIILATATIASFFVPYLTSSITVALPAIGNEFSLDAVSLGWVMSAYILSTAICIVPFGRLADIYGRKRIFLAGVIIMTVSSLFASLAWDAAALIAFRILQGAGGAMIFTTSVAIVAAVYPPERRGWALGITLAAVYSGLSTGPCIGGILTGLLGWRSIFLVIVPLGLAVVWFTGRRIPDEWIDARGARFDRAGSVLYAAALFSLMYGLTIVPDPAAAFFLLSGGVLLGLFLWYESRSPSPVFDIRVFSGNTAFTCSNLAALINYAATYAVAFLLSLYLQYIQGLGPGAAGLVLVAQPAVQVFCSPVAGRLSDRIEPRIVATSGHGDHCCRPLPPRLSLARYTPLVHCRGPPPAGSRVRALLLPEHECDHVVGRTPLLWCCIQHGRHHAGDRAAREHRDRHDDLLPHPWQGTGDPGGLSPFYGKRDGDILCPPHPLHHRCRCKLRPGQYQGTGISPVILQPGMMRGSAYHGGEPAGRIRARSSGSPGTESIPPGWRPKSRNFSANQKNRMIPAVSGMQDELPEARSEKKIT